MTRETEMAASALFNRAVGDGWISCGRHGDLGVHERMVPAAASNAIVMEKRNRADGQQGFGPPAANAMDEEPEVIVPARTRLVEILDRLAERARIAGCDPEGTAVPRRIEHQETGRS